MIQQYPALIPYITAGDPDLSTTQRVLFELEKAGADVIELGIPFSDPSADGGTIQNATERALKNGFEINNMFEMIRGARAQGLKVPIVLFGYLNPFFQFGFERIAQQAQSLGIKGLLILDLPAESSRNLNLFLSKSGVELIYLVSPTTSPTRLELINQLAGSFVYCVARTGTTGRSTSVDDEMLSYIESVRKVIHQPLAIGFGLHSVAQIESLKNHCEAFVIGSAITQIIENSIGQQSHKSDQNLPTTLDTFLRPVAEKIQEIRNRRLSCSSF